MSTTEGGPGWATRAFIGTAYRGETNLTQNERRRDGHRYGVHGSHYWILEYLGRGLFPIVNLGNLMYLPRLGTMGRPTWSSERESRDTGQDAGGAPNRPPSALRAVGFLSSRRRRWWRQAGLERIPRVERAKRLQQLQNVTWGTRLVMEYSSALYGFRCR